MTRENEMSYANKWMTLGLIQRADELRNVVEMLVATMEDLMEQMENMEECLNVVHEGTDSIQDRMEELTLMMEDNVDSKNSHSSHVAVNSQEDNTPWF